MRRVGAMGGEKFLAGGVRESGIEGHGGVAALPDLRKGLNEALSGLGDRYQFLHRG